MTQYILNINYIYTSMLFGAQGFFTVAYCLHNTTLNYVVGDFIYFCATCSVIDLIMVGLDEYRRRMSFQDQ